MFDVREEGVTRSTTKKENRAQTVVRDLEQRQCNN